MRLRIRKIHLKETKRFKDLIIDLGDNPKRLVALIGPNGCGKSSVFDAIVFLNTRVFAQVGNTGVRDNNYYSLNGEEQFNINNIDVLFDNNKNFSTIARNYHDENKGNTIISFRSPYRYSGVLKVKEARAVPDIAQNQYGASSSSDVDQRIDDAFRRLSIKFNQVIRECNLTYKQAMDKIVGELNNSIKQCLDIELVDIGDINDNRGTLFFKKRDSGKSFEYNVLSSGEKEVIDILLDLYLRKDVYNNTVYIVDEPELHINTSIQRKLLIEINRIVPENCQIWIATHSIGFMRALQVDFSNDSQIIRFDADKKWASEKYELKPMLPSRKEWLNVFETAVDDLVELISPNTIIYCEGKAEPQKNGRKAIDEDIYNVIFALKHPNVQFISAGGDNEPEQRRDIAFRVFSKVFANLKILVLKDMDNESGKEVNNETREKYLNQDRMNYRILNRFEIENYLYDKEILKKYCDINKTSFDENEYDSLVTDIVNDHVKDMIKNVKECCGIDVNKSNSEFKMELAHLITEETEVYKELEKVIFCN